MSEHVADRPSWRCRSCGLDWPCPPRRAELADEPTLSVALYLSSCLSDAVQDLPLVSVGDLRRRFLTLPPPWETRPGAPTRRGLGEGGSATR